MTAAHIITGCDILTKTCHEAALASGWWTDESGNLKPYNTAEKLMLIVSELGEAMEGDRKGKQDEHLPQYKSLDVELADALIRIFDLAGRKGIAMGEVVAAKLAYNAQRADHKPENRAKDGGKKY